MSMPGALVVCLALLLWFASCHGQEWMDYHERIERIEHGCLAADGGQP